MLVSFLVSANVCSAIASLAGLSKAPAGGRYPNGARTFSERDLTALPNRRPIRLDLDMRVIRRRGLSDAASHREAFPVGRAAVKGDTGGLPTLLVTVYLAQLALGFSEGTTKT